MLKDIGHPYAEGREQYDITFENVQAGERTSHLFRLANLHNAMVVGTGDLSELALGWCTYGVGDHMSHYAINASVPKTLIQHVIRWVADTHRFGAEASATLLEILATQISPELVPSRAGRARPGHRGDRRPLRAARLQSLLYLALRLRAAEDRFSGLVGMARSRAWRMARHPGREAQPIRSRPDQANLRTFLYRFFQTQSVQAQLYPQCAEGRIRRIAVAARRLPRPERWRSCRLAHPARPNPRRRRLTSRGLVRSLHSALA